MVKLGKQSMMNYAGLAGGAWFGNNTIIDDIQKIDVAKATDQLVNLGLAAGAIFAIKVLKLKGIMVTVAYVAAGYFLGQAIHGMASTKTTAGLYDYNESSNYVSSSSEGKSYITSENPYNN